MVTMIIIHTHSSWTNWFINHESDDAGNINLQAFSDILSSGDSNEEKLKDLVDEIDTVILAAEVSKNIMILHSPKNFGGKKTLPENKVIFMIGLSTQATCVLLDLNTAFADLSIVVPTVQDLAECISATDLTNIPAPEENGLVGFEGLDIFIPGPILQNTILTLNTKNTYELIPQEVLTLRTRARANAFFNCRQPRR
jgi:hypothetical protein